MRSDRPASAVPPDSSGESQGRDRRGRWRKGVSGNPLGPPAGSRHRTTRALEALLDGEAEGLTRKAVELALAGDTCRGLRGLCPGPPA
jgi:hypothetical protein